MATIADDTELVTLGIDTHADIHVAVLDAQLARLVDHTAPDMVARHGVGPQL